MKTITHPLTRTALAALPIALFALAGCAGSGSLAATPNTPSASRSLNPEHMIRANALASTIAVADNDYTDTNLTLEIKGYNGVTVSKSRSECASFLTLLLRHSYNLTDTFFQGVFASDSPYAYQYHDKIGSVSSFTRITKAVDLDKGDILAIRYTKTNPNSTNPNSGHIMLVNGALVPAGTDTTDGVTTNVFDIPILDVTKSPHGTTDSRKSTNDTGVGTGTFRIYVSQTDGSVVAHKWSPNASDSTYRYYQTVAKGGEIRHLEMGRFVAP